MALSKDCLSAIQNAGAAAYVADAMLKEVAKAYADSVRDRVSRSPFDRSTDELFEVWKTVARLSKRLGHVESEIREIFETVRMLDPVGLLSEPKKGTPLLIGSYGADSRSTIGSTTLVKAIEATDVAIKNPRRSSKTVSTSRSRSSGRVAKNALSPNTMKLLNHLRTVLNTKTYTAITRSIVGVDAGLPLGSVGASFSKLLSNNFLMADSTGGLLLVLEK